MGFTAGLYACPKYEGESLSKAEEAYIANYINYDNNEWAQKNYSSPHEYGLSGVSEFYDEGLSTFKPPVMEKISFYNNAAAEIYDSKRFVQEFGDWCSNGSGDIYRWFEELSHQPDKQNGSKYGLSIPLTSKEVSKFAEFCYQKILKNRPKESYINYSFNYINSKEEGEDDYLEELSLKRCDGVEFEIINDENDELRRNTVRVPTNEDCEYCDGPTYIIPDYDEWEMSGYYEGLTAALKILTQIDFDNFEVYYDGGW